MRAVGVSAEISPEDSKLRLTISNHGPGPIYNCDVTFYADQRVVDRRRFDAVHPTGQFLGDDAPPGFRFDVVEMDFTDPEGKRWRVDSNGVWGAIDDLNRAENAKRTEAGGPQG